MLCFLPPMPAEFDSGPPPRKSRDGDTRAIVLVILVVVCALLAPFGNTARQQVSKAVWTAPSTRPTATPAGFQPPNRP